MFRAVKRKRSATVMSIMTAAQLALHLLLGSSAVSAVEVRNIRSWTAPDHTRIVLDISGQCVYTAKVLTGPDRIVIEIPSGTIESSIGALEVNDGVLTRVRVNRLRSVAQIVLDLPRETKFRHFALDPNNIHPHRIVVDLKKEISSAEARLNKEKADEVAQSGDFVVIVDPGHGGSYPGTCSGKLKEKDITLQISKMIAAEIGSRKGFRAVLTREGDYDVDLYGRIERARSHGGHCFVSVHVNSSSSSKPRGSEVYFLSLGGTSEKNMHEVAERENMFIEMGEEAGMIEDDVQSILFDLARSDVMHQSSVLAEAIGEEMSSIKAVPFRGVKQDNFVILHGIKMPSVLVETAFLSNRRDSGMLVKESFQKEMAEAIANGVMAYMSKNPPAEMSWTPVSVAFHIVSKGETLWGIAKKYGISVAELRDLNGIGEKGGIRPGQKLRVAK